MKSTNPKDLIGTTKVPAHLWPPAATAVGSVGLLEGALKYGRNNWREHGVLASVYVAAAKRHLDEWFEGADLSLDSSVPHLGNALACLAILVDAQAHGKLIDDRNYGGAEAIQALNSTLQSVIAGLTEQYGERAEQVHHYTIADNHGLETGNDVHRQRASALPEARKVLGRQDQQPVQRRRR